jgi:pre-mRNA-processing factor SLU7
MRANPNPELNPEEQTFAGDNFQRYTGDALKLAEQQILSWEMQQRGEGVDAIANPSQMELATREFKEKKTALDIEKKKALASKYGNAATTVRRVMTVAMPPPAPGASTTSSSSGSSSSSTSEGGAATVIETRELDPRLRFGQSETYQEYNPDGTVKRAKVAKATTAAAEPVEVTPQQHCGKTHYAEDVYENNHTSVFGSYYNRTSGEWGFACCWQCLRSSYCTGDAGKRAIKASLYQTIDVAREKKRMESMQSADTNTGSAAAAAASAAKAPIGFTRRSDVYGEGPKDVQLDEEKMKAALARAEAYQQTAVGSSTAAADGTSTTGKRKNRYNGDKDAADAQDPAMQSKILSAGGLGNAGRGSKTGNDGQGNREDAGSVSVEDMEVFRLKRLKQEDPMATLLDSEELLEYKQ